MKILVKLLETVTKKLESLYCVEGGNPQKMQSGDSYKRKEKEFMKKRMMLLKANKILAAVMTASMLTSTVVPGTAVYAAEISAPEVETEDGFSDGMEEETPVVTQNQEEETPEFNDGSVEAAGDGLITGSDENTERTVYAYDKLIEAISDSSIEKITLGSNIVTTDQIVINRSLTIDLAGKKIKGSGNHRIFKIEKNCNVTLKSTGTEGTITGGAVSSDSQLDEAEKTSGGAIFNKGNTSIENIIIEDNKAFIGGGIYNDGTSLTLNNVIVRKNTGTLCGAGINAELGSHINLKNVLIELNKNTVDAQGGVGLDCYSSAVVLDNVVIKENKNYGDSWSSVAGARIYYGSLILKNRIIIADNEKISDEGNSASNLFLCYCDNVSIAEEGLTDANINLYTNDVTKKDRLVARNCRKQYLGYFHPEKAGQIIGFKEGEPNTLYIGSENSGLITDVGSHEWQYECKEDKILFKCTADDECEYQEQQTLLQLKGEDIDYSGNNKAVEIVYGENSEEAIKENVNVETTYTGTTCAGIKYSSTTAPTEAGEYTATANVTFGNKKYTLEKNFKIRKVNPEIKFVEDELVYSESDTQQSLISDVPDGMEIEYQIDGGKVIKGIPTATEAGTYKIHYTYAGDANHNSIDEYKEITVKPASAESLTVKPKSYADVYDGKEHSATVTATDATVTYSENVNGKYETTAPEFKNVGTYTVYYKVTKKNYETKTGTLTVEISPKNVTVEGITAEDKTYDGNKNAVLKYDKAEINGAVKGDDLKVTATGTFDQAGVGENIPVKLSDLSLSGNDKENYNLMKDKSQPTTSASIKKKQITISITPNGGSYGKVAGATATASGVVSGDEESISKKIKFTYSGTANDGTEVNDSSDVPEKAGNYTVSVSLNDPNYELDSSKEAPSADFKVAKAKVEVPDIIYKEADGDKTQTADIKSDSRYTIKKNDGGNKPGVYDVTLELTDPDNYEWNDADQKDGKDISLKFEITEKGKIPTSTEADTKLKDMDPSLLPVSGDEAKKILKNTVNADGSKETEDVKNLVNSGNYTASANLKVEEKTKEQIADKAAEAEKAIKSGEKIGAYLDASLSIGYISTDGTLKGNVAIKDTGDCKQTMTTTIPEELRQDAAYTVRSYYVVRVSEENGKLVTEKVDSSVKGNQITFTFDKSAVYAIVYKDTYYAPSYPVTGIKVSTDKVNLTKKGETAQVKVEVTPSYADNKNLTWKSSDEKVATVDKNGKITAVGNGTATITVTSVSGNYTATITVTVKNESEVKPGEIEKITVDAEAKTLTKIGESVELKVKVEPENADSSKLTWKSSDEKVAVVDKDGKVTAVGNGTATITVTTEDGKHTASVTITVKAADEPAVNKTTSYGNLKARSVKQTNTSVTLEWTRVSGADGYLIYGNRCNGNGKTYKYQKLATITNGNTRTWTQTGLKKGTYYKYVVKAYKLVNGKKVVTDTSVSVHAVTKGGKYGVAKAVSVTKIGSKKNTLKVTLKSGKTAQITAKEVKMDKAIRHHRNICYESSNTKVATVTPDGLIQATGKGTCSIWVYAQNGVYKTITVTVK